MSFLLSGRGKGVEMCWNQSSPFAVADVSGWQHRSQKYLFETQQVWGVPSCHPHLLQIDNV